MIGVAVGVAMTGCCISPPAAVADVSRVGLGVAMLVGDMVGTGEGAREGISVADGEADAIGRSDVRIGGSDTGRLEGEIWIRGGWVGVALGCADSEAD